MAAVLAAVASFISANNLLFLILTAMLATFDELRRRVPAAGK
jgi:hypothetical protein